MTASTTAGGLLGLLALMACTQRAPPAGAPAPPLAQPAWSGTLPGPAAVEPAPPPPPDPCARFKDDIDHLRCQWVIGPDRSEFVPAAGESAPLEVQVQCLPVRDRPQAYAECIVRGYL